MIVLLFLFAFVNRASRHERRVDGTGMQTTSSLDRASSASRACAHTAMQCGGATQNARAPVVHLKAATIAIPPCSFQVPLSHSTSPSLSLALLLSLSLLLPAHRRTAH